ncbi:MAG: ParA family protein [Anaerolineae bacterium]
MKTRVIAVSNVKGGVGKTTTVVNMGAGLALLGRRVLVVDADAQANATFALFGSRQPAATMVDVMLSRRLKLVDAIEATNAPGVDMVASQIGLSAADLVLAAVAGRERLLARYLREVKGYDYILIDTPPALSLMSVNSLVAAREVFVPVSTGMFALMGIGLLETAITELRENLDQETPIVTGAVATLYDRTRAADDTVRALANHFGSRLFSTVVPRYKDVQESQGRAQSIFQYAPHSQAAIAFHNLVQEVIRGEKEG